MKTTTCKACGRPIVWIRTTKGKSMPCDAEPVAYKEIKGGKEKIVTPNGEVISCATCAYLRRCAEQNVVSVRKLFREA